jgi:RNA polymerase sigma-70 factor (ECF subfamily)
MQQVLVEESAARSVEVALVERARSGDIEAFDALARRRVDGLYRTALAIVRNESDARDATQEALIAAWRQLPRLRDPGRFDVWLTRILVNACRTLLRRRNRNVVREITVEAAGWGTSSEPTASSGSVEGTAEADAIGRAFARLDTGPRALLVLHHVEERPLAEIAAVLGVPVGTVKWRLHDARRALERALRQEQR